MLAIVPTVLRTMCGPEDGWRIQELGPHRATCHDGRGALAKLCNGRMLL